TRDQVERIVDQYLNSKAPKFRTKALITYRLAEEIKQVLSSTSPYCEIGTASFRHWARTRFLFNEQYELCFKNVKSTSNDNSISLIGKPVGLKEDLYEILTTAHQNCHHRGRDVTYEQVKKRHSLVPKQLCDMVVKACSYCN
ncbi:hypothetical protein BDF20DRAFT_788599, partial [Mycotypha africana]|uniref:uncharacterized protein n=1 Tax=Mycotypha africana TaxID=64632 RepID=UPI0022FFE188